LKKHQKRRIRQIKRNLNRLQENEKRELLREFDQKWLAIDERMYTICERFGGHEYRPSPNRSRNLARELLIMCPNCGKYYYDETNIWG
jgi:hypothetical protein